MRAAWKVLAIAAFLVGCGDDDDDTVPGDSVERQATVSGEEGFEELEGEANVQWTEGVSGFTATMQLRGDEPGQVRPWHVHFGTCETGGAIVGSDEDYGRLTVDEDGTAFDLSVVPAPLSSIENYHVNVHLSEEEMETIIACGDLDEDAEEL